MIAVFSRVYADLHVTRQGSYPHLAHIIVINIVTASPAMQVELQQITWLQISSLLSSWCWRPQAAGDQHPLMKQAGSRQHCRLEAVTEQLRVAVCPFPAPLSAVFWLQHQGGVGGDLCYPASA